MGAGRAGPDLRLYRFHVTASSLHSPSLKALVSLSLFNGLHPPCSIMMSWILLPCFTLEPLGCSSSILAIIAVESMIESLGQASRSHCA